MYKKPAYRYNNISREGAAQPRPGLSGHMHKRDSALEFHWLIHDTCNYRCPYCPRAGGLKQPGPPKKNQRPPEVWTAAWRRVHRLYGACRIYITGGEPTLFPAFTDFVHALSGLHEIVFDTNLSWSQAGLEAFSSRLRGRNVKVNLSFHPHTADAGTFIKKALFLKEGGFGAACRIIAFPPLLPELERYAAEFDKAGLTLTINPFRGALEGLPYPRSYSPSERRLIMDINERFARKNAENAPQAAMVRRLIGSRPASPLGKPCTSGSVYACVEHDGTVYRCMRYAYKNIEPMGNILDEEFRLGSGASPCGLEVCEFERKYLAGGEDARERQNS